MSSLEVTTEVICDGVVPCPVNFSDLPVTKERLGPMDWLLMSYGSKWPSPFPLKEYTMYLKWYEDWQSKGFPNERG